MNVGDRAPDLALLDQEGNEVSIGGLAATGPLVLYFYIKAMTPL